MNPHSSRGAFVGSSRDALRAGKSLCYAFVDEIDSNINSNYNGLQLTAEKRLSHGLSLLASYTCSKAG
jgi:hypothetical protein